MNCVVNIFSLLGRAKEQSGNTVWTNRSWLSTGSTLRNNIPGEVWKVGQNVLNIVAFEKNRDTMFTISLWFNTFSLLD